MTDAPQKTPHSEPPPPEAPLGLVSDPELAEERARVGQVVAERYQILELIGLGGMGAVYRAQHVHMRKFVALKVLHREMTTRADVVMRFEREAVAAGRIQHANVVAALDFGRLNDGSSYLALEYVAGRTLSEALPAGEAWPLSSSLSVAWQVASALEAAHAHGIVHRDLKPENIMVVDRASGGPWVKVLDFGIARVRLDASNSDAGAITQLGVVFGTPEYMSPEQAMGQAVDERGDLYCLGLVLFRLLTGRAPYSAETVQATLLQQVTMPVPALPDDLPAEVSAFLLRLLDKDPAQRIQSATEARVELLELMEAQGVSPPLGPTAEGSPSQEDVSTAPPPRRSSFAGKLDRSVLGVRIKLLGNSIPLWRLMVFASVIVLFAVGLRRLLNTPAPGLASGLDTDSAAADGVLDVAGAASTAADRDLARQIASALVGDVDAVRGLELRPESERTTQEWLALARLYAEGERLPEALVCYERVLEAEPALASDVGLRKDISRATLRPEVANHAMRLAARRLGAFGADLLYFVWVKTKDVTASTQLANDLLHEPGVAERSTPALQFLLRWRAAINCDDYRRLLLEAAVSADERASTLLARTAHTECNLDGPELEAALQAAASRAAPNVFQ